MDWGGCRLGEIGSGRKWRCCVSWRFGTGGGNWELLGERAAETGSAGMAPSSVMPLGGQHRHRTGSPGAALWVRTGGTGGGEGVSGGCPATHATPQALVATVACPQPQRRRGRAERLRNPGHPGAGPSLRISRPQTPPRRSNPSPKLRATPPGFADPRVGIAAAPEGDSRCCQEKPAQPWIKFSFPAFFLMPNPRRGDEEMWGGGLVETPRGGTGTSWFQS